MFGPSFDVDSYLFAIIMIVKTCHCSSNSERKDVQRSCASCRFQLTLSFGNAQVLCFKIVVDEDLIPWIIKVPSPLLQPCSCSVL